MKILVLFAVILILIQIPLINENVQNLSEINIYHLNFLNSNKDVKIIMIYKGNFSDLYNYFSYFNLHVEKYGDFYTISGKWYSLSKAINFHDNKAYLPEYIKNNCSLIYIDTNVSSNLIFSNDPYTVNQTVDAYNVNNLINMGYNGKNFTAVVVVPYGDPNITENTNKFNNIYNLPPLNLTIKYFLSKPKIFPSQWVLETDLDVETIHAFAPGADIILAVSPDDNVSSLENVLKTVIEENIGNVISLSWGGPEDEIYDPYFHEIFKEAAYKNITVIASSGDSSTVEYPASDPYVVGVGGTTLYLNNNYIYERAWSESGGGYSSIFTRPPWQFFLNSSGRGVPDISLDGNPQTGIFIYSNGITGVGGTSLSAPIFAGMLLDLYSKLHFSLGYFLPQLYYMKYYNPSDFHDVYYNGNVYIWHQQIGLGSPEIDKWTFPVKSFSTDVFLGNYTNVENITFEMRGFSQYPMHRFEENSFYVEIRSYNLSFDFGIYDNGNSNFFYGNGSKITLIEKKVVENNLYNVSINFQSNFTIINIDDNIYSIPLKLKNVSLYVFAESVGPCSFYTNLGPVEFRDFHVNGMDVNSAYLIQRNFTIYGAMEIPFIKNDFLIGKVTSIDKTLWPSNYKYIYTNAIILKNENNLLNYSFIVGTGKHYDPFILSGLILNSSSGYAIYLDLPGYYLINECYANSSAGILYGKNVNIVVENSKFHTGISNTGIYIYSSTVYFKNDSIFAGISIISFYSNIYIENSTLYIFPLIFSSVVHTFSSEIIFFIIPLFIYSPYYVFALIISIFVLIYLLKRRF